LEPRAPGDQDQARVIEGVSEPVRLTTALREMEVSHKGGVKSMSYAELEAGIEMIRSMLAAREAGEDARVIEAVPKPVARKRGAEAQASPLLPDEQGEGE
jgi:hypothetical protein